MDVLSEKILLELWELGQNRHPIDRALLLCCGARPDLNPDILATLPLGWINGELLGLRAELFGDRLELPLVCAKCQALLEINVNIGELLMSVCQEKTSENIEFAGFCFRQPSSKDLASIACELDAEAAALQLLEACCLARPEGASVSLSLLAQVDSLLETADPLADLHFASVCPDCGKAMEAVLDPGVLLWDELQAYAGNVLSQVHVLASAYGWTESEVLDMAPGRRKRYLDMVVGG